MSIDISKNSYYRVRSFIIIGGSCNRVGECYLILWPIYARFIETRMKIINIE
jgi:hypothetical protein